MDNKVLRVALIGLGKQMLENHLLAINEAHLIELDSVCDTNEILCKRVSAEINVPGFSSVKELLSKRRPDFAILSVPHSEYLPILKLLLPAGVHVLKEKPFATSMSEAREIHELANDNNALLAITLVRRYHPIYSTFPRLRPRIGIIHSIEGRFTLNIDRLDEGWRSKKSNAGGGAVLDLGYHSIDLIVWYFGLPNRLVARIGYHGREEQSYDVEDTGMVLFSYDEKGDQKAIMGNLVLSRTFPNKTESLTIVGSRGTVTVERGSITRMDTRGEIVENINRSGNLWLSAVVEQLEEFADNIRKQDKISKPLYFDHFAHMAFVEAIYKSATTNSVVDPRSLLPDFVY